MQPKVKISAGEKRLRLLSEQVKQHLTQLGCTLLTPSETNPNCYDWKATLPTDAGTLALSCRVTPFADGYKTDTIMIHGRFDSPELFPREFCECNHINPFSGKWNVYIVEGNSQSLTDALQYYSRMIPILDNRD